MSVLGIDTNKICCVTDRCFQVNPAATWLQGNKPVAEVSKVLLTARYEKEILALIFRC